MKIQVICTFAVLTMLLVPPSKSNTDDVNTNKINYVFTKTYPCEYKFDPVCGTDGITYTNKCMLDYTNNEYIKMGYSALYPADESYCRECICQKIYYPVCTASGITYPNECELYCENIRRNREKKPIEYLEYRSACYGPSCDCTTVVSPVCGSNGISYRNRCVLDCASVNAKLSGYPIEISFKNVGTCLDGCYCPDTDEPVCGSDGWVYRNLCYMACQNRIYTCSKYPVVTVANSYICDDCKCPSNIEIVCGGGDNMEPRNFRNPCEFNCARLKNPQLKIISNGPCLTCFCTDEQNPVCGTDQLTYRNECQLRCAIDALPKGQTLSIFHQGPCTDNYCDCTYCSDDYEPVCGADGLTYWNICWFNCGNNCKKLSGYSEVVFDSTGYCYNYVNKF